MANILVVDGESGGVAGAREGKAQVSESVVIVLQDSAQSDAVLSRISWYFLERDPHMEDQSELVGADAAAAVVAVGLVYSSLGWMTAKEMVVHLQDLVVSRGCSGRSCPVHVRGELPLPVLCHRLLVVRLLIHVLLRPSPLAQPRESSVGPPILRRLDRRRPDHRCQCVLPWTKKTIVPHVGV